MSASDVSSALYWLPRVTRAMSGVVPPTVTVEYDHRNELLALFGEKYDDALTMQLLGRLREAAEHIGYPVFIRTDQASAKHDGPTAYLARGEADLLHVVRRTVEDMEMKFGFGGPTPRAFLVRKYLTLNASFSAFGQEGRRHPIAREWRYFANQEGVACRHFYWPAEAISEAHSPTELVLDWRHRLAILADPLSKDEDEALARLAHLAASVCPDAPAWSVDFAQDQDGKWWLIDMAHAAQSWHPDGCPHGDPNEVNLRG